MLTCTERKDSTTTYFLGVGDLVGCQVGATAKRQNLPTGTRGLIFNRKVWRFLRPCVFVLNFPQKGLGAEEGVTGNSGTWGRGAKPTVQSGARSAERSKEARRAVPRELQLTPGWQAGDARGRRVAAQSKKRKWVRMGSWLSRKRQEARKHSSRLIQLAVCWGVRLLSRKA